MLASVARSNVELLGIRVGVNLVPANMIVLAVCAQVLEYALRHLPFVPAELVLKVHSAS